MLLLLRLLYRFHRLKLNLPYLDVLTPQQLANDGKVKVAGIDVDGVLRGKVMHKDKFLSIAKSQSRAFGFCRSVVPSLLCPAIMLILCPFSSL